MALRGITVEDAALSFSLVGSQIILVCQSHIKFILTVEQVCQSQIHRGPKKQIGYNPRAGLVQCLLKHIEMIARSLLNQDLTLCII